jgi:hypothetical protein
VSDDCHVRRRIAAAQRREVLAEDDIKNPVQTILDAPVTPDDPPEHRRAELCGTFRAAGETALTTKAAIGEELESDRLKVRPKAALIDRDLLNEKIAILEARRPLAQRRFKP